MKKTGVCPKCGGNKLKTGERGGYSAVRFGFFFNGATQVYVCRTCGYCEEYLIDKHLKKLQQR